MQLHLCEVAGIVKIIEKVGRVVVTRVWAERNVELLFKWYRISF